MGFFSLVMLDIALELALKDPTYEDMASKFFEHFVAIVDAMNALGGMPYLCYKNANWYHSSVSILLQVINKLSSQFIEIYNDITKMLKILFFILGNGLWHETDGFYYDKIRFEEQEDVTCRIRSMVGLIPLFSVLVLEEETVNKLPGFKKRLDWFLRNRSDISDNVSFFTYSHYKTSIHCW